MSRKLSHDFRFVARTAPGLYDEMGHFVLRAAGAGLKFRGRKVGVEAALNAIVLDFLAKPEAERLALLRANLPRFEAIMAVDPGPKGKAAPPGNPGPVDDIPEHPDVDVELETPAPPSRRPRPRKNSG